MRDLLLICTKNVNFPHYDKLSSQKDGVAIESRLEPVIVRIFIVDLERNMIPKLSTYMTKWKRYVDDTITYIEPNSIDYVLSVLKSFHKNIKFTVEEEKDNNIKDKDKILFLDVLILRNATPCRKLIHNVYLP